MTPSSVLVVKPSSLGDIVHTLPAVHFLKTTFRNAEISWIANTEWVPLLEQNADLKTVIPFPRGEFKGPVGIVKFCPMVPRTCWVETRSGPGFSRVIPKRMDLTQREGQVGVRLVGFERSSRFFYDKRALVHSGQHSVDRYLALAQTRRS